MTHDCSSDDALKAPAPPFQFQLQPPGAHRSPRYRTLVGRVRTYLAACGGRYSVHFCDLRSGATWGIAHRRPIFAASTVKVPIVLYAYQCVAAGSMRLTERIPYDPARHYEGGSGVLKDTLEPGEAVTLRALSRLCITISDNVATQMLVHRLTRPRLMDAMRKMGGRTVYPGRRNVSTAQDMTAYLWQVVTFSRHHPKLGGLLLDDLCHTIYNRRLPRYLPDGVLVAHKVGDWPGIVNDVGIVFHPEAPYTLSVLGEPKQGEDADEIIGEVSQMVFTTQTDLAGSEA